MNRTLLTPESLESRTLLTVQFGSPSDLNIGLTTPTSVVLIDADADSDLDLVVGGDQGVEVFINDGDGNFGSPFDVPFGQDVLELIRGDLDGDGPDDLFIRFDNGGNAANDVVGVASFAGGGAPQQRRISGIANIAPTFAVGNFDNVNGQDVALYDADSDEIALYLNGGSGFPATPARFAAESGTIVALIAGDFDGDGIDDFGSVFQNTIVIYTGPYNGGAFGQMMTYTPGGSAISLATVGDFNGDGMDDIGWIAGSTLRYALANGTGSFGAAQTVDTGAQTPSGQLIAGDVNADGREDMIFGNGTSFSAVTSHGAGFNAPVDLAAHTGGTTPLAVTIGDFDGDSDRDIGGVLQNGGNDVLAWRSIRGPQVGSFGTSQTSAAQGDNVTLAASQVGADPLRSIAQVTFGYDANGNGLLDSGEVLHVDTVDTDGFQFQYAIPAEIPVGNATFLAVAQDSDGLVGPATPLAIQILYSLYGVGTTEPSGAAGADGLTTMAAVNSQGELIVYEEDATGNWSSEDLSSLIGNAEVLVDPAVFASNVTGLMHVAAPTADGLWLLTRDAQGVWTAANLTTSVTDGRAIMSGLTAFAYTLGGAPAVTVAGLDVDGQVISYTHATNTAAPEPVWSFRDLSAAVMDNTGAQTPQFVGSLVSYVTSWGGLNIAGLDAAGDIHTVWTGSPSGPWFTSNLTDITGAPAYEGEVTPYVTSWGGINIAGLNTAGSVLITWWVPQFGGEWRISDLTDLFSGPAFAAGGITSYVTPWGGLNVAGVGDDGEITIYWWVPQFGGQWEISAISTQFDDAMPRPTGPLASHASPTGTLNVFGASADGEITRASWNPGDGGTWTGENLTDVSSRG